MNYNSSQIKNISTQSVAVNFTSAGEQSYELNCQFVPDLIEVQACVYNIADNAGSYEIQPMNSGDNQITALFIGSNIYEVRSNVLPNFSVCCNGTNTYNPVYSFTNNSRQSIGGSYLINVFNLTSFAQFNLGGVVLSFKFIRFADK